jgi:hypothetical protein
MVRMQRFMNIPNVQEFILNLCFTRDIFPITLKVERMPMFLEAKYGNKTVTIKNL